MSYLSKLLTSIYFKFIRLTLFYQNTTLFSFNCQSTINLLGIRESLFFVLFCFNPESSQSQKSTHADPKQKKKKRKDEQLLLWELIRLAVLQIISFVSNWPFFFITGFSPECSTNLK